MAANDLVKIAKDSVDAFSRKQWDRLKQLLAPDCIYEEEATGRRVEGPDALIALDQQWTRAFPDGKGAVTSAFATSSRCVLEIRWEGTQDGELELGGGATFPPSGRRATVTAVQVLDFDNGKITECRHYFDLMTILRQLGALPLREGVQPALPT